MKIKAKTGDLALGIFSILGGIIILILTKVQGLQLIKSGQMGPGFFPTICGIAIAICGAMVLLEAARRIARAKTAQAEKEELETNILNLTELKNLLLFMLLGTGVLLLSDYLGLLTCLGLSVIAYLKIWGREKWIKSIVIGVCMVAFLYGVLSCSCMCRSPKVRWAFKEEVHIWTCCITLRWASQSWLIP